MFAEIFYSLQFWKNKKYEKYGRNNNKLQIRTLLCINVKINAFIIVKRRPINRDVKLEIKCSIIE